MTNQFYCILLSYILVSPILLAQNNFLDLSYCETGTCTIMLPSDYSQVDYMELDSLDNLYLTISNLGEDPYLLKVTKEGLVDTSFGNGGRFEEGNFTPYQKDNFIFTLFLVGEGTRINLYDLDLNLIQDFNIPEEVCFENVTFDGDKRFGYTRLQTLFQFNRNGTLDESFGTGGLHQFNITFSPNGLDAYSFTDEDGVHFLHRSNSTGLQDFAFSTIDKNGDNQANFIIPFAADIEASDFFSRFLSRIHPGNGDNLFLEGHHFLSDLTSISSEIVKTDLRGNKVLNFGEQGSIFPPLSPESSNILFTIILGELDSGNLILAHSTLPVFQIFSSNLITRIASIFAVTPEGELLPEFGSAGFLIFPLIPGQTKYYSIKDPKDDIIYLTSSESPSASTLHITKLNLDGLPGTSVSNSTNIDQEDQSISLYPNPTANATSLLYTGPTLSNAVLQVLDPHGPIAKEIKMDQLHDKTTLEIETHDLANGPYIINLSIDGKVLSSQKLVVFH